MQQFDLTKRFHLVARTKENQERLLKEFDDERQFHYYMGEVNKQEYKEAMILECLGIQYPINRMSCEFPDHTPYFKKLERRKENESRRKNI